METRLVRAEMSKRGLKAWVVNVSEGKEEKLEIRNPMRKAPYCLVAEGEEKKKVFLKDNEIRALRKAIEEVSS